MQIKVAEQHAELKTNEAEKVAATLIEKAQSDRVRRLESAKNDAREISKKWRKKFWPT